MALHFGKTQLRVVVCKAVVKAQEHAVQLADDDVLVVALVARQRAVELLAIVLCPAVSRQVVRDDRAVRPFGQRPAELEPAFFALVQVGLVVGAAAVDAVEVELRRAEVDQRVDVVLLLHAAGGVEGDVVVDELAEVGVAGVDAAVLFVVVQARCLFSLRRRLGQPRVAFDLGRRGHAVRARAVAGKLFQRGHGPDGCWQAAEHAAKASFGLRRAAVEVGTAHAAVALQFLGGKGQVAHDGPA